MDGQLYIVRILYVYTEYSPFIKCLSFLLTFQFLIECIETMYEHLEKMIQVSNKCIFKFLKNSHLSLKNHI